MTHALASIIAAWTCAQALGCAGSQHPPEPAPAAETATPSTTEPPPSATGGAAPRPELTAEACEANGGSVVGDIGDGRIHRPEYRCPNGTPPSGTIRPAGGAPMAIEGSVCCPP